MPAVLAVIVCSVQWFLVGYTLTYGEGGAIFGDFKYIFHRNVLAEPVGTIPAVLFSFFQLVFQATVCAIAVGGACERGRLLPLLPFIFVSGPRTTYVMPVNASSFGRLSSTTPWHTWYGEVDFSWISVLSTLLEVLRSTSTLVRPRPQCRFISRTLCSDHASRQLEHPPIS
jgi:ammonia channel protein AmtB